MAVGRNIAAGGDASIEGALHVGHDVFVGGRLEARAFRGCDRGFFLSEEALAKAYPIAEPGWWALVGDTLPAAMYAAVDGKWVPTGKTAGTVIVEVPVEGTERDRYVSPGVAMFHGEVRECTVLPDASPADSGSDGCCVAWAPEIGRFVLVMAATGKCYQAWGDDHLFADASHTPYRHCLYVDADTNRLYRYEEPDLVLV